MEFPYGLGTVYKQHKGRCKCIEKQVHMWEGRVVSSREMDRVKSLELTKGHTATAKHRDLVTCYCMLHDNCRYLSASTWTPHLQSTSTHRDGLLLSQGLAATFSAGDVFDLSNFSHAAKRLRLSTDAVNLTCSCNLHQYFHSVSALICSQTLFSDLRKAKLFSVHLWIHTQC